MEEVPCILNTDSLGNVKEPNAVSMRIITILNSKNFFEDERLLIKRSMKTQCSQAIINYRVYDTTHRRNNK